MKKETSKQESYISYLNGVIHGIELARQVFNSQDTPSIDELTEQFKQKADRANARLDRCESIVTKT